MATLPWAVQYIHAAYLFSSQQFVPLSPMLPLPSPQWQPLVCSYVCESVLLVAAVFAAQPCPTLCPPGSSVHGILQARVLEWVVIPFSSFARHICFYYTVLNVLFLYILTHSYVHKQLFVLNSEETEVHKVTCLVRILDSLEHMLPRLDSRTYSEAKRIEKKILCPGAPNEHP